MWRFLARSVEKALFRSGTPRASRCTSQGQSEVALSQTTSLDDKKRRRRSSSPIHVHKIHHSSPDDPFPHTPQSMGTNLVDFLDRTDMHRRRTRIALPDFCAGSYVAVTCSDPFAPKAETRFVGICIARRNSRIASNFTLRNVVGGEPVEMTYDLYSPRLRNIEVLKLERRRRAKLYYLRNRPAKQSTVSEHMPKTEPVQGRLPPRKTKR